MSKLYNPVHSAILLALFISNSGLLIHYYYQSEVLLKTESYEAMEIWLYFVAVIFTAFPLYTVATESLAFDDGKDNPFSGKSRIRAFIHNPSFIRCFLLLILYSIPVLFLLSLIRNVAG